MRKILDHMEAIEKQATQGEWTMVEAGGWYSLSAAEDWMRDADNFTLICLMRNNLAELIRLARAGLNAVDNEPNDIVSLPIGDKTMSSKPRFRIAIASKDKTLNIKHTIAVVFEREPGKFGAQFNKAYNDRPGVAKIVLTDGTEISPDDFWLNFYDESSSPF
jgi:hypothetical protein